MRALMAPRMMVVVLLAAGVVALQPSAAGACSCATGTPAEMLATHDAAFIGRPIDVRGGFQSKTWTFDVDQWLKKDLGNVVRIQTAGDSAACGFELTEGDRVAIFITIEGSSLRSGLCSTLDADAVLAHVHPQKPVAAEATLVVASSGEEGRHLWLFNDAGELAATTDDGGGSYLQDFALCPGGQVAVELWHGRVVVRDLATLAAIRTQKVSSALGRVWCRDDAGKRLLGAKRSPTTGDWVSIVRPGDAGAPLATGDWTYVEITGDDLIATVGREQTQLRRISLGTGQDDLIYQATDRPGVELNVPAGIEGFTISPDQTRVAFEVTRYPMEGQPSSDMFIFDLRTLRARARNHLDTEGNVLGWIDDDTMMFTDYGNDTLLLNATDLRTAQRLPSNAQWVSLRSRNGTLLGMDGPRLSSLDPDTGEKTTLATVPAQYAGWIRRLPQPLQVAHQPREPGSKPTPANTTEPAVTPGTPPAPTVASTATSIWPGLAAGAGVLLVGAAAFVLVRRRRTGSSA